MAEFRSREIFDFLGSFPRGMNRNLDPLLLSKDTLAYCENGTVRGSFVSPRPPFIDRDVTYPNTTTQVAVEGGLWQGGCYYLGDDLSTSLIASISGRLYRFLILVNTVTCSDITGANTQSVSATQCWLWQAENYVWWNDGINNPVTWDGAATTRMSPRSPFTTTAASNPVPAELPPYGYPFHFDVTSAANMSVKDVITVAGYGTGVITIISANTITVNNLSMPVGLTTSWIGAEVSWKDGGLGFPPGRMGAYGMGRVAMCLADGKRFIYGDIVGGPSGTAALNFRDAILNLSENYFIVGGGTFTIPASGDTIRAMKFVTILDAALGQGPLQVFTSARVFSCNVPVDRTTWQNLTNPILTESLIENGGMSQDATVAFNGDTVFRSPDGIRSLIFGRREFDTFGNVPQSQEVAPIIATDDQALLAWDTAVVFDNRLLMATGTNQSPSGVYFTGLIALNGDPLSNLSGKAPSCYDGLWTGRNILLGLKGTFAGKERMFCFFTDLVLGAIKLTELMPTVASSYQDNDSTDIVMPIESSAIFGTDVNQNRDLVRLLNGEIWVDELQGTVTFQSYFKPDQYPVWVPWHTWTETYDAALKNPFRPRMGMGEPDPALMDEGSNRPLREGFSFQFRLVITGSCRFVGARFKGVTCPQPEFAPPS